MSQAPLDRIRVGGGNRVPGPEYCGARVPGRLDYSRVREFIDARPSNPSRAYPKPTSQSHAPRTTHHDRLFHAPRTTYDPPEWTINGPHFSSRCWLSRVAGCVMCCHPPQTIRRVTFDCNQRP